MAITVKHTKVSAIPDDTDTSLIRPSDWNADHTLVGTVPITNGGTGQSTATDAFNALAPSQTGNTGKYLTTDGTNSSWATNPLGTVTSVAATAGTGISVTGSPITTSGTLNITNTAPDQTVSIASGTGISATGTYPAFTVTNTAPDQVVALTGAGTTTVTGTYPSFTITSTDSKVGDVVGPASATDNAIARYDLTTGKLIQNSLVIVDDTGATTGITTLSASTSVTTPVVQASNSGGLSLKNSVGTTQMSVGAGGGDNMSINVSTNLNGANAQIDISPTGTGHVHIKPTGTGSLEIAPSNVGTFDNMTIGATTPKAITGTIITATTFVGSGASLTGVVTSVTGTSPVASSGGATPAISMPAATTSVNGYLTSTDWTTFNNKSNTNGTVTSVAALTLGTTGTDLSSTVATGTTTPVITLQVPTASATNRGALSSADWTTFNNKGSGTVTSVTGTAPVVSSGGVTPAISMAAATTSVNGYLTSTDWTTFNNKAPAVTYTSTYVPYGQGTTTPALSANFTYDPTLKNLSAPQVRASNGIVVNSKTVSASYSIASGDSAMSVGPVTVATGQTVTVASGSRWVVL
jgi:hypothetical protein